MGIKGLSKLLQESTSGGGIKSNEIKSYFGRKIAIDASMALYQFLIAVRQAGGDGSFQQLTNEDGQVTSHLIGMLYRTIRMMENGIKPLYVFDGKPPDFKAHELEKRKEAREKAKQELEQAEKADDAEKVAQMQRRLVKVDKTHVAESQRLLDCLGVPWIAAPGEAEAQCAILVQKGLVFGTATEDMDALTFGTPILLRHLTHAESRKLPVLEFNLKTLLKDLEITMDQFIDICILCGCDYIPSIKGIGPKKALQFIKEYKNIETLIENLDTSKYEIPDGFLYKEARELFKKPDINNNDNDLNLQIKWGECDKEKLIDFLVKEKGFSLDRIESAVKRINKCKGKSAQRRVDSFFQIRGVATSTTKQIKNDKEKEKKEKEKAKAKKLLKSNKKSTKKSVKKSTKKSAKKKTTTAKKSAKKKTTKTTTTTTKTSTATKDKTKSKETNENDNNDNNDNNEIENDDSNMENENRNDRNLSNDNSNGDSKSDECNENSNSNSNSGNSSRMMSGQKRKRKEFDNDSTLPDINSVSLTGDKTSECKDNENENDNDSEMKTSTTMTTAAAASNDNKTNKENDNLLINCDNEEKENENNGKTPMKGQNILGKLSDDDDEEQDFDVLNDKIESTKTKENDRDTNENENDGIDDILSSPPRKKPRLLAENKSNS